MWFDKKCKDFFEKAQNAVRNTFTPQPQLQPIRVPVPAKKYQPPR